MLPWLLPLGAFRGLLRDVATVHVLGRLADGDTHFGRYFRATLSLAPSSLHAHLLLALKRAFGIDGAGRFLTMALVFALPLSSTFLLRRAGAEGAGRNATVLAILALPILVTGNQAFVLGSVLAFAALALCAGADQRWFSPSLGGALALFLLAALADPLAAVLAVLVLLLFRGSRLAKPSVLVGTLLSVGPCAAFLAVYAIRNRQSDRDPAWPALDYDWPLEVGTHALRPTHDEPMSITAVRVAAVVFLLAFAIHASVKAFGRNDARARARARVFAVLFLGWLSLPASARNVFGYSATSPADTALLWVVVAAALSAETTLGPRFLPEGRRGLGIVVLFAIALATTQMFGLRRMGGTAGFERVLQRIPRRDLAAAMVYDGDDAWAHLVLLRDTVVPNLVPPADRGEPASPFSLLSTRDDLPRTRLPGPTEARRRCEDGEHVRALGEAAKAYGRLILFRPLRPCVAALERDLQVEIQDGDVWLLVPR